VIVLNRIWLKPLIVLLAVGLHGDLAAAHGFGQRYDLPVPLSIWVIGAGLTILLTFILASVFTRSHSGLQPFPRVNLYRWRIIRISSHPSILLLIRLLSVSILVTILVSGFFGSSNPYQNISPVLVWVIWWVGIVFICALVGDLWALINPFLMLFVWIQRFTIKAFQVHRFGLNIPYPESFSMWPAVLGLIGFFWAELLWGGGSEPFSLAIIVTLYGICTLLGMYIFSPNTWLQHADPFTLVFSIFSRFSPLEIRVKRNHRSSNCNLQICRFSIEDCVNGPMCITHAHPKQIELNLRIPAVGLLEVERVPLSMMVFVLILLSSVTFDGFLETPFWFGILDRTLDGEIIAVGHIAFILFPTIFCLAYLSVCWLMLRAAILAAGGLDKLAIKHPSDIACSFVLTLVPIAIAYHLAHYLSFLLITGQYVVPLISDPLGLGWNLFNTADYNVNIGVLDAKTAWYIAVATVVFGHVFSVYIAHIAAKRIFHDKRVVFWGQIPMIILMVIYTMLSLWILAQPMVG